MKPRLLSPFEPPTPDDSALVALLQNAGYSVRHENLYSIYRKMIQTLGDNIAHIDHIRREDILRLLFDAQIRKGAAFTLAGLKAIADPREETEAFHDALQKIVFASPAVFRRGYEFACPYCEDRHWYSAHEFSEQMTCRGCEALFQPPLETAYFYKINELVAKGLKNGALTVLLTLRKMAAQCDNLVWHSGYQLRKDGQSQDIDLALLCDGSWTLFECKDSLPEDEDRLIEQIQRTIQVAQAIGAEFHLSTLEESLPEATAALLKGYDVWLRADLLR